MAWYPFSIEFPCSTEVSSTSIGFSLHFTVVMASSFLGKKKRKAFVYQENTWHSSNLVYFFLKIISMFHRVLPDFNGSHKTQLFSLSFFFFFFLPSVWVIDHVMLVERAHLGEYLLGFYRVLPSFTEFLPAAVRLCHRIVPGPTRRVGFVCLFVCLFFIIVPSFLPSFHVRPSNWP